MDFFEFFGLSRRVAWVVAFCGVGAAFLFLLPPREIAVVGGLAEKRAAHDAINSGNGAGDPAASGAGASAGSSSVAAGTAPRDEDAPLQPPLQNPPGVVKGIYLTSWSAGSASRIEALTKLVERSELNGMVIDIKDYSGYAAYRTGVPEIRASGAEDDVRILKPNQLIKNLHDKNIYLIGRISVFQDPVLAKARPEFAIKNKKNGKLWIDRKGLSWLDAAAKPVWDYNIALAKDALARGFDEVNFDYIRFPSDGDLAVAQYPFWDEQKPRHRVIEEFFAYVREQLPGARISADIFGLTVAASDDMGIGQLIEDAYRHFDYVSPMVYPSHFSNGFEGYKNPAQHPYEIILYSMQSALSRLRAMTKPPESSPSSTTSTAPLAPPPAPPRGKLRPWLQAFDLGAVYDAAMIKQQIRAVEEVLAQGSSSAYYAGWLLWDPSNNYRSYPL